VKAGAENSGGSGRGGANREMLYEKSCNILSKATTNKTSRCHYWGKIILF
jgi:hypothetical protein